MWNLGCVDWNQFQLLCLLELTLDVLYVYDDPIADFTRILFNIAKQTIPHITKQY